MTDGKRARPFQTVKPLADDLGIIVDTSCGRDDPECVSDVIENYEGGGNILVCWEHHRMTDLAEELGYEDAPFYPDDRLVYCAHQLHSILAYLRSRYDLIWTDPFPYTRFMDIASEECPGLD